MRSEEKILCHVLYFCGLCPKHVDLMLIKSRALLNEVRSEDIQSCPLFLWSPPCNSISRQRSAIEFPNMQMGRFTYLSPKFSPVLCFCCLHPVIQYRSKDQPSNSFTRKCCVLLTCPRNPEGALPPCSGYPTQFKQ